MNLKKKQEKNWVFGNIGHSDLFVGADKILRD